jgi:hypothetical protein
VTSRKISLSHLFFHSLSLPFTIFLSFPFLVVYLFVSSHPLSLLKKREHLRHNNVLWVCVFLCQILQYFTESDKSCHGCRDILSFLNAVLCNFTQSRNNKMKPGSPVWKMGFSFLPFGLIHSPKVFTLTDIGKIDTVYCVFTQCKLKMYWTSVISL